MLRWERNWDLREPGEEERRRGYLPSATRHLLLIRHLFFSLYGVATLWNATSPSHQAPTIVLNLQARPIQPARNQWQGEITHRPGQTTSCRHSCQVLALRVLSSQRECVLSIIIAGWQRFLFPTPTLPTQTWQGDRQSACNVGTKENVSVCDICRAIETAEIVAEALPNTPVLPVWLRNGLLKILYTQTNDLTIPL